MADDDVKFIDAESYQGRADEKLTFKMIVLEHLRKIGGYSSCEFLGGYWQERPDPRPNSNAIIKIYIPDSREVYSNSVEYLYDILYPHFDEEMKKIGQEAEKMLEDAYNENTDIIDGERRFKNVDVRITFRDVKRQISRELFRELSCFLYRQKYMEGKSFIDET
ncbi:hypothetical protein JW968_00210 [Candidatus Woesearchaeota archaeon]|nr:hypothetical protein [Candidatus Woesearchaeota archaeon]